MIIIKILKIKWCNNKKMIQINNHRNNQRNKYNNNQNNNHYKMKNQTNQRMNQIQRYMLKKFIKEYQ